LLAPPMALEPLVEAMVWADRNDVDPSHRWLRERLVDITSRKTWSPMPGVAR